MPARPLTLIKHLHIAGWPWSVRQGRIRGALGLSDPARRRITIAPGQAPLDELDTLLHELMHSILRAQGRPYDEAPEELYVTALATGLTGALNDNPQLLAYIRARLDP